MGLSESLGFYLIIVTKNRQNQSVHEESKRPVRDDKVHGVSHADPRIQDGFVNTFYLGSTCRDDNTPPEAEQAVPAEVSTGAGRALIAN